MFVLLNLQFVKGLFILNFPWNVILLFECAKYINKTAMSIQKWEDITDYSSWVTVIHSASVKALTTTPPLRHTIFSKVDKLY